MISHDNRKKVILMGILGYQLTLNSQVRLPWGYGQTDRVRWSMHHL